MTATPMTRSRRLVALVGAALLAAGWIAVGLAAPIAQAQDLTPTPAAPPLEGYALGPEDAALTIIMYGDFQCAICARYARDVETVRATYPDDIRLVWRYFPDTRSHDKAALALQAAEAAAAQGRFWEMHDELFAHLDGWIDLPPDQFRAALRDYAGVIGLDVARFDAELDAGTYAGVIEVAQRDAAALDVVGVPFLLFNGVPFSGRDDFFGLDEAARLALLVKRQFPAPPPYTLDPAKTYRATLVTEEGEIVIDLYADAAPWAVNSFVFLAQNGWYDDNTFFYVIPDFLVQSGDPSNTGRGTPGYTLPDEHANGLRFDQPGRVALAQPDGVPDSAGSAFFITLAALTPSEDWDGQYTIFGQVIAGLDVAGTLTPRNANDPVNFPDPPPGDRLITVRIEELPQ
jgi:cyclophilin family peptidyl-prolyl cis-trans isomerase/protein-disulfide isomerase